MTAALSAAPWAAHGAPPATQTWQFRDGAWVATGAEAAATQPASDPTLDRAEALLARGKFNAARDLLLAWERTHKTSPERDRALLLLADAFYQYGDRVKAFYYCDEVMDAYPDSRLYYPALEKQYQIADSFLNGFKLRFLGMPVFENHDQAIEMLYRIQQRAPGSPLAERSLLRTADHYYASAQYDLSGDAYAAFVRSYPRSPHVPVARLRSAYSALAQFRGLRYDATPILDARAQLADIARTYPELSREQNLPEVIDRIDTTFARKLYVTADFYRRTNEPRAAVYNYRYLIQQYPRTDEARRAEADLKQMPQWALETAAPGKGTGYSPDFRPPTAEQ